MTITVIVSAHCLHSGCGWTTSGDWASVDPAAERHTKQTKHATATTAAPASERPAETGRHSQPGG
jgi:hypothetical protein